MGGTAVISERRIADYGGDVANGGAERHRRSGAGGYVVDVCDAIGGCGIKRGAVVGQYGRKIRVSKVRRTVQRNEWTRVPVRPWLARRYDHGGSAAGRRVVEQGGCGFAGWASRTRCGYPY